MPRFLISFNDGDMDFPEADLPEVGRAAHAVMRDAMAAGAWIVGGGFLGYTAHVVTADGSVRPGPLRESPVHLGGFTVLEVDSEDAAYAWAARFADACRCPQEVRAIMPDPEQESLQAGAHT